MSLVVPIIGGMTTHSILFSGILPSREVEESIFWQQSPVKKDGAGSTIIEVQAPTDDMLNRLIRTHRRNPSSVQLAGLRQLARHRIGDMLTRFEQGAMQVIQEENPDLIEFVEIQRLNYMFADLEQDVFDPELLFQSGVKDDATYYSGGSGVDEPTCVVEKEPKVDFKDSDIWTNGNWVKDPFTKANAVALAEQMIQDILIVAGDDRSLSISEYCHDVALGSQSILRTLFSKYFGLESPPPHHKVDRFLNVLKHISEKKQATPELRLYVRAFLDQRINWKRFEALISVPSGMPEFPRSMPLENIVERDPHSLVPYHHNIIYAVPSADGKAIELFFQLAVHNPGGTGMWRYQTLSAYIKLPVSGDPKDVVALIPGDKGYKKLPLDTLLPILINHSQGTIKNLATKIWEKQRQVYRQDELSNRNPDDIKGSPFKGWWRGLGDAHDQHTKRETEGLPLELFYKVGDVIDGQNYFVNVNGIKVAGPATAESDPIVCAKDVCDSEIKESQTFKRSILLHLAGSLKRILNSSPLMQLAVKIQPVNLIVVKSQEEMASLIELLSLSSNLFHRDDNVLGRTIHYKGQAYIIFTEEQVFHNDWVDHVIAHEFGHLLDVEPPTPPHFGKRRLIRLFGDRYMEDDLNSGLSSDDKFVIGELLAYFRKHAPLQAPSGYALAANNELYVESLMAYIRGKKDFFLSESDGFHTAGWKDLMANPKGKRFFLMIAIFEHRVKQSVLPVVNNPDSDAADIERALYGAIHAFSRDTFRKVDAYLCANDNKIELDKLPGLINMWESLHVDEYIRRLKLSHVE